MLLLLLLLFLGGRGSDRGEGTMVGPPLTVEKGPWQSEAAEPLKQR